MVMGSSPCSVITPLLLLLLLAGFSRRNMTQAAGGRWQLLQNSIGITAMHMQLLHNDRVIVFDRTDFGRSNLSLPNGKCRNNSNDLALQIDCTAHSIEYDPARNKFRALFVQTDVWCSSGAAMPDGRLVQTGGFNDGDRAVRTVRACNNCDWEEDVNGLGQRRWYATNHILPDGRQIIIGGRRQFNYEFYPKTGSFKNVHSFPFLVQTDDAGIENNLYPFVFLSPDGNLFVFANNRAVLFSYAQNKVVRTYPTIPGGDPRCYPSTGSAVLLPIKNPHAKSVEAEVLVCGGAPKGAYKEAMNGKFVGALNTCGRIKITDPNPNWVMETMPLARVMGDMTLLPNGHVLVINGAAKGTAGWEIGRDPVLHPVDYNPDGKSGSRFEVENPTTIPRMYHSTAILLRDGRVLVGGSNAHADYRFVNVLFPTELRLEAFHPSYMDSRFANLKPTVVSPRSQTRLKYRRPFTVRFTAKAAVDPRRVAVTMEAPSFTTHSFSMNQRMLVLGGGNATSVGKLTFEIRVTAPPSAALAPMGYYMLFVVHRDIPSEGIWVRMQ